MSRRSGEQGRVTLRVSVDEEGRVLGIEVARSSGHLALDLAATRAVRDWRFRPAMREGQPVLATAEVGITFRLQGDQAW
jgi:protein TonB